MPRILLRAGVLVALVSASVSLAGCGGGGSAGSRPVTRPPVLVAPAPAPAPTVATPSPRQNTCQTFCQHMMGCVTELAEPGLTVWSDVASCQGTCLDDASLTAPVLADIEQCGARDGGACKPFVECIWNLEQAASARANGEG